MKIQDKEERMKKRKGKREKSNKEEKYEGMRQRNQGFEKKFLDFI